MSNKKRLFGMQRLNPFFALFFVAVSVAGGWLVYRASHAAAIASITFQVIDVRTNQVVPNVDLRIRSTDDRNYCTTPYTPSNYLGVVNFTNCVIGNHTDSGGQYDHYYFYYVSAPGYTILQPTGYSNYYKLYAGKTYSYTFAVQSPTPPPPPTPSGCGNGTLNDQCASIGSFTADASPVPYSGGTGLRWSTSWASSCSLNGGGVPVNGTATTGNLTANKAYTLSCSPANPNGSSTKSLTVTVSPAPTMSINASPTSFTDKGTTTVTWNSTNATGCVFQSGTSNPGAVGSSGSWTSPSLTASTTYAMYCANAVGYKTAQSSVGITVGHSAPPPPPTCTTCGKGGGGGTSPGGGSSPVATGTGDSQAPSSPANLKAAQNDPGSIDLQWDASSDNVGVSAYIVERSTDQATWVKLSDSVTDVSYTDNDITFNTHYYYRVSAADAAGNVSAPASTDITTQAFTPNVKADSDATITSDDGVVVVNMPAGSVSVDAYCSIPADDNDKSSLPKDLKVVAGTYMLSCKDAKANDISSFNKQLEFLVTVKNQGKKLNLYFADGGKWSDSKVKYSSATPSFKYNTDHPKPLVVLAAKQTNGWLAILIGILLFLILLGGAFYFIRQRSKRQTEYDSYIRQQYINATTPDQPAADVLPNVPTPEAPQPGQSTGQVSPGANPANGVGVSVGELAQQMAQNSQVQTPAAPPAPSSNPINNNPLVSPAEPQDPNQTPLAQG
jgi:hypothetical protein